MPRVESSYGPGNTLNTTMDREGMDIGPTPDIWGDLEKIRTKLKPATTATARQQAPALSSTPMLGNAPTPQSEYDWEPTFAVHKFPGGTGGGYMSPYTPGDPLGGGQAPVATGYQRVRRG
jgi:hypothetical protein